MEYNAIGAWLSRKGITLQQSDIELVDSGNGPQIVRWSDRLGARPTDSDLATVTASDATTWFRTTERGAELDVLMFRVLARATHVRFGRADAASMTAATWRNILETTWDAERGA